MNKNLKIVGGVILVAIVIFAIVSFVSKKPAVTSTNPASDVASKSASDQASNLPNSVISSIKDAIGLGKPMKCTYSTTVNGQVFETTSYVNGQKSKSTSVVAGKSMNTLFDGDTMYTWTDGETAGTKMALSCINDLKASLPQGQSGAPAVQSPDDQFKSATNISCVAASGTDFSVPAGVTFTDQCAMLKNSLDAAKNLQNKIPANIPNMPNIPGY